MKILMTVYPDAVVWPFAIELSQALARDGVTFTFAVLGGPLQDAQRAQLRRLLNVEFYESTFRPDLGAGAEVLRTGEWLLELAARSDADIIHLNELCFGGLPWRTRPLLHVLRAEPMGERERASVRAAGALVAPSHAALDEVQSSCGAAPIACVIPPGRPGGAPLNPSRESMIVGAGVYDDPAGNLAALVRTAARASWPVFLIADAPVTARALENVHFLGVLEQPDRWAIFSRAAIFARAARAVDFCFDVLDAAMCGCALVLGDVADLREQWDGAAAFVNPNDDESLDGTLLWLINDAEARADLAERARQRAAAYSAEKMASAYLSLYIELALRSSSALYERIRGQIPLNWSA